jgi:hydroxyacylglutathione hydrolase/adenylyltransferase/sulfurtransferase
MSAFADPDIDLSAADVAARMARGEMALVDIREQYEWDAGRVPGSHHVEIERVASNAPMIPRDMPVAFLCRAGVRAGMVAQAFRAVGYDAYNVEGGFGAWFAEGLPVEPESATVAPH